MSYQEIFCKILEMLDEEFDFNYNINKVEFEENEVFVYLESGTEKFESKCTITDRNVSADYLFEM